MASFLGWIEAHPGLASWVQGIGSILSVAVAVFVAVRLDALRENRRRAQPLHGLIFLANGLAKLFGKLFDRANSDDYIRAATIPDSMKVEFISAQQALAQFVVRDMPTYEAIVMLNALQTMTSEAATDIQFQGIRIQAGRTGANYERWKASFTSLGDDLRVEYNRICRGGS